MDSQKRLMVALSLCFGIVVVWSYFFGPKAGLTAQLSEGADAGVAVVAPPVAVQPAVVPATVGEDAGAPPPPLLTLEREFPSVHLAISTAGGGLVKAQLQGPKMRENERYSLTEGFERAFGGKSAAAPQVDLGLPTGAVPPPLSVAVEGSAPFPAAARYAVEIEDPRKISLTAQSGTWRVTKRLEWPEGDGSLAKLEVALQNTGTVAATGELSVRYSRVVDPSTEEKGSFFGGVGNQWKPACRVAEKIQKKAPDAEKPPDEYKGPVDFFGVDQQYFLAAVIPAVDEREGRCVLHATLTERTVEAFFPLQVAPGQTVTRTYNIYLGPKDSVRLATLTAPAGHGGLVVGGDASPHVEKAVEFYAWLVVISQTLLVILNFFYGLFHNWGVAIILLTVLVKLVLFPLTYKQMVSAEQMKKLQPKMEAIKKKYPDDRERQNMETMKLYQEAKVNPLGGCLPLLVQMPVWFALYNTLRNSFEIYREPFISPIWADLTSKDPTYILPVALGITMILTQRLQPQVGMDPNQQRLLTYVMPGFFSLLMLSYPAGLALYIFTNNLLSIGQSYALRRYLKRKEAKT